MVSRRVWNSDGNWPGECANELGVELISIGIRGTEVSRVEDMDGKWPGECVKILR